MVQACGNLRQVQRIRFSVGIYAIKRQSLTIRSEGIIDGKLLLHRSDEIARSFCAISPNRLFVSEINTIDEELYPTHVRAQSYQTTICAFDITTRLDNL